MKSVFLIGAAAGALVTAAPAFAQPQGGHGQHDGHAQRAHAPSSSPAPVPTAPPTAPTCTLEHAAMGHCRMPESKPASVQDPDCPPDHAKMGHCIPRTAPVEGEAIGTNLPSGDAPAPRPVAANYANRVWGEGAMQPARNALRREHGGGTFSQLMIDLAEVKIAGGHEGYKFEADAWFGGDVNRFVVKADGEGEFGEAAENLELKALYSRAVDPYFNLQAGVRQDLGAGPSRTHAVIGIAGLAPYWFKADGYLYLSTEGQIRASASAEYDQRLTQYLILQPKVEFDLSAQNIPELGIGSGLTSAGFGLRLRYEFAREFAPYTGFVHEVKFGRTAEYTRTAGRDGSSTSIVAGIRAWF